MLISQFPVVVCFLFSWSWKCSSYHTPPIGGAPMSKTWVVHLQVFERGSFIPFRSSHPLFQNIWRTNLLFIFVILFLILLNLICSSDMAFCRDVLLRYMGQRLLGKLLLHFMSLLKHKRLEVIFRIWLLYQIGCDSIPSSAVICKQSKLDNRKSVSRT